MGSVQPSQTDSKGSTLCDVCQSPTQFLRMPRWQGILRLLSLNCHRGHRTEGQGTTPQPQSLPNGLRVLRSIPTQHGGSGSHCRKTIASDPVTRSVSLYELANGAGLRQVDKGGNYAAQH